jgi:hypothetical protein
MIISIFFIEFDFFINMIFVTNNLFIISKKNKLFVWFRDQHFINSYKIQKSFYLINKKTFKLRPNKKIKTIKSFLNL